MIDPTRIVYEYLTTSVSSSAATTLNGAVATTTTRTITLTAGSAFSGYDAPLVLKVGTELMIGAVSTNTFTVDIGLRGALGTTAALHDDLDDISLANLYMISGSAIYADYLPNGYANAAPAVMFRVRGGEGIDPRVPAVSCSFEFFCYGGSAYYDDSAALCRALNDRLHGTVVESTTSGTILAAHEEVAMQNATEPDTEWPRTFSAYRILLRSL